MATKSKKSLIVALLMVLVLFLGIAAYRHWNRGVAGSETLKEAGENTPAASGQAVIVVPEVKAPAAALKSGGDVCRENQEKLKAFFTYLDRQDYIVSRQLPGGSSEHLSGLVARLLKTPPFVMQETDSLLRVIQNRAHFYRVLGKKDILLLRDILQKEAEMMESTFALFYQTMTLQEKCKPDGPRLQVSLQELYPYAVYFLNTLGGSAYLMRRDSRIRALTQCYAILLIDEANQRRLNHLGLDIRPPLDLLLKDMQNMTNLTGKEEYIATLTKIRAKQ